MHSFTRFSKVTGRLILVPFGPRCTPCKSIHTPGILSGFLMIQTSECFSSSQQFRSRCGQLDHRCGSTMLWECFSSDNMVRVDCKRNSAYTGARLPGLYEKVTLSEAYPRVRKPSQSLESILQTLYIQ